MCSVLYDIGLKSYTRLLIGKERASLRSGTKVDHATMPGHFDTVNCKE